MIESFVILLLFYSQAGPNIENTTLYDYFTRDESLNRLRKEMEEKSEL